MSESSEVLPLARALSAHVRRARRRALRRAPAPAPDPGPDPAPQPDRAPSPVPGPDSSPASRSSSPLRELAAACTDLASLRSAVAACRACALCATRTQTVFADGSERPRVLFVGEAPGADEDAQGVPFVGRAGRLLTDIITKGMGMAREDVAIANVLKCRPPENRDPSLEEKRLCGGWLERQIELLDPEVIVPLGRHAAGYVLQSDAPMGRMRGRVHRAGGRKVVPTYHPAYLLRSPHMKKACWEDIQLALAELGLKPPGRV